MKHIKLYEYFLGKKEKESAKDDSLGEFILSSLNDRNIKNFEKNEISQTYDSEIIFTFTVKNMNIKVREIEETGIYVYVQDDELNLNHDLGVKIYQKCVEIVAYYEKNNKRITTEEETTITK